MFVAPVSGTYQFLTSSDDASWLWVGDAGTTIDDLIDQGMHRMRWSTTVASWSAHENWIH